MSIQSVSQSVSESSLSRYPVRRHLTVQVCPVTWSTKFHQHRPDRSIIDHWQEVIAHSHSLCTHAGYLFVYLLPLICAPLKCHPVIYDHLFSLWPEAVVHVCGAALWFVYGLWAQVPHQDPVLSRLRNQDVIQEIGMPLMVTIIWWSHHHHHHQQQQQQQHYLHWDADIRWHLVTNEWDSVLGKVNNHRLRPFSTLMSSSILFVCVRVCVCVCVCISKARAQRKVYTNVMQRFVLVTDKIIIIIIIIIYWYTVQDVIPFC